MKVLHIHFVGQSGGSGGAISMRRLHFGLRRKGIDSKILCVRNTSEAPNIIVSKPSRVVKKLNSLTERITTKYGLEDVLNLNAFRIRRNKAFFEADVVNFHRIPNVFSYLSFPLLSKNKPAVFTLCEMWSITGHCRYGLDCTRWKNGCGKCPHSDMPPAIKHDFTHLQWKLKKWAYSRSNLTVVSKSKFMVDLVKQSILKRFPVYCIPNGVDTEIYKPYDPKELRSLHNISSSKKVLLFAAQRFEMHVKGSDLLIRALNALPKSLKNEIVLILFGRNGKVIVNAIDIQAVDLGFIDDDITKAMAYSAADLFLCPSRYEMFANTIIESLSCGTPVVSFETSGCIDTVRPGITGYLAEQENPNDFCNGIVQLLEDNSLRNYMSKQCRMIAKKEYSIDVLIDRYVELYDHVVGNGN